MSQALTPLAVSHADVLRFLATNPGADTRALAEATGRIVSNVRRDMPRLQKDGLVTDDLVITPRAKAALEVMDGAKTAPRPGNIIGVPHAEICPSPLNPRREFDEIELDDLRLSIRDNGLLQNLVVREIPEADQANGVRFWIVAGERRWRAIGREIELGTVWPEDRLVPCKVVSADAGRHTEVALVENLQRVQLTPMEEARGFQVLHELHQVPTADIARRVRRTQRFVQQRLQLLDLPDTAKTALEAGLITVEQARQAVAKPKPKPAIALPEPEPAPLLEAMGDPRARSSEEERPVVAASTGEMAGSSPARPTTPPRPPLLDPHLESLLRDVEKHPHMGLTSYAQSGRWVESSWVARRFDKLFADGLISQPRAPTITAAGAAILRALDGLPPLEHAATADAGELAAMILQRLVAARAAIDSDGSIIAGIRRAHHDELWEPAATAAFLQRVHEALR